MGGYLLPSQISGYDPAEFVCITLKFPNVPEYRAAVLGQLTALGSWWSWELTGGTTAAQAAHYWRELLLDARITDDCADSDDTDNAPYWSPADAASAAGAGSNWEYVGDWLITGFLAAAGSPAAALIYRTLAPRARLAFRSQDLGMIADVFIDGILALSLSTASAQSGITEIIEANIDLVQFAAEHSLPSDIERIIRIVPRAA